MSTEYFQLAMVRWTPFACTFHLTHCSSSTDEDAPYCYGYTYPQLTATNYICDTTFNTEWETVLTSFNGDNAGHSWTPLYESDSKSSSTSRAPAPISSTSSQPVPVPPTPTPKPPHHVPAGAIAGGVVGGLLAIGAIVCAVLFMCLRKKKQNNAGMNANNNANNATASEYNGPVHTIQVVDTKAQMQAPYSPPTQYLNTQAPSYSTSPPQHFTQQQYSTDPMHSPRTSIVPPYSPQSPPPSFRPGDVSPIQAPMHTDGIPQVNTEGNRVYEAQG
jgi:hypothetical protein